MSENLVESVEFRVVSQRRPLPGLDAALAQLRALNAQTDALNGKLSGLSTLSSFKRSKGEMEELLKSSFATKRIPVKSAAEVLGVPDIKDFEAFVSRWKAAHKSAAASFFTGRPGSLEFTSPGRGAEIARKYFSNATGRAQDQIGVLQALFGKGGGAGSGTASLGVSGTIPLVIPASQIVATVGPGPITATGGVRTGGAPAAGGGGAGAGTAVANFRDTIAAIHRTMAEDIAARGSSKLAGGGDLTKVAAIRDQAAAQIRAAVGASGITPGSAVTERALEQAAKLESGAEDLRQRAIATSMARTRKVRDELARAQARGDAEAERGLQEELKRSEQDTAAKRRFMERRITERNRMLAAGQRSDEGAERARMRVTAFDEKNAKRRGADADSRVRRGATHAAAEATLADFLQHGGIKTGERTGEAIGPNGRRLTRVVTAERQDARSKEGLRITFDAEGAKVERFKRALADTRAEAGYLAGDFVKNTAKVTLWAASVGVLYKSIELARTSLEHLVETGAQMQRLDQVFRQVGGTTQQLASDILHVAAVNGRSDEEAMQSAIQWSRLGLTRAQVNEAVTVSLMAANVANTDAAKSTEMLQAVMQTYGLRVMDLRGVLGELNQISNTYNVTNNDLLEGLSRTAAAAKATGLPLQELMGLIGSTVGATGQSGANIGNAIKSITLALSNPALQQKLRSQFRFEPTTGGEGLKDMSTLLADLYVKYQHLNDAQRQSLLFSVAGRTQANRLASMLDNYVQAQALAVNAQLNLNSAEVENVKIKSALRAQLQGLNTEWQRFVLIQGNRGPVQAMTQVTSALRNVLTLMNSPVGSAATTGLLGLLAAGGAKSILTGMSLQGGPGFLSRSGAAVMGALRNFNGSMVNAYAASGAFGTRGLAQSVATRGLVNAGGRLPGGIGDRIIRSTYLYSEALLRVGQSSNVSSGAVRGMATALGATTRAIGIGLVAIQQWLMPMAIVAGGIYAFNRGMEAVGLSSEHAEAKLAGFNQEAQRAGAAANAYAEAAQLMRTTHNALAGEKGFAGMRPEAMQKMLGQVSEVMFIDEPDLDKRRKMTDEMREQLKIMGEQKDVAGVLNAFSGANLRFASMHRKELQTQYEANQKEQRADAAELKRLETAQRSKLYGDLLPGRRQQAIDAIKTRMQERSGDQVRNLMDQGDTMDKAFEDRLQYDEKHLAALERERVALQSIAELYQRMPGNNALDQAQARLGANEAEQAQIKAHLEILNRQDDAGSAADVAAAARLKQRDAAEGAIRRQLDAVHYLQDDSNYFSAQRGAPPGVGDLMNEIPGAAQRKAILKERAAALDDRLRGLEADATDELGDPAALGAVSRQKQREADLEALKQRGAEHAALVANMERARAEAQFQLGTQAGERGVARADYGIDEADRLLRRRGEIDRLLATPHDQASVSGRARDIQLEAEQYRTILGLRERAATVERDINQLLLDREKEFRRSLFESGPGDLLRKLAAFHAASDSRGNLRALTPGAMLAMSPEFRRDVGGAQMLGMAAGHPARGLVMDPQYWTLLNERNRLRGYGAGNDSALDQAMMKLSDQLGAMVRRFQEVLPREAFDAGAKALGNLGTAADTAASQLAALGTAAADALKRILGASGLIPATGQYGGRGGGAGYLKKH
jgi:TP901 family phage tail tape measure protein